MIVIAVRLGRLLIQCMEFITEMEHLDCVEKLFKASVSRLWTGGASLKLARRLSMGCFRGIWLAWLM